MKKRFLSMLSALMLCLGLGMAVASCDVHEFPHEGPDEPEPGPTKCTVDLHLDLDAFDLHRIIDTGQTMSSRSGISKANAEDYFIRYIVRAYPITRSKSRVPRSRASISCGEAIATLDGDFVRDLPLSLPAGEYELLTWCDFVSDADLNDLFYNTGDLTELSLVGSENPATYEHKGSSSARVAWRGQHEIIVDDEGNIRLPGGSEPLTKIVIEMEPPMARYEFETTDLDEFIRKIVETGAASGSETTGPLQVSLDDYEIRMAYTSYMPCAYNAHTDKPYNSITGVTYIGEIKRIDNERATLASDYVLVNGSATSVQVALNLCRKSTGELISATPAIDVPLRRGHFTIVRGKMLTTTAGGSLGINTEFDGEFNIEIR